MLKNTGALFHYEFGRQPKFYRGLKIHYRAMLGQGWPLGFSFDDARRDGLPYLKVGLRRMNLLSRMA
jgi:hypothetical protein